MPIHNPIPAPKTKQIWLYIILLIAASALMLSLRRCNTELFYTKTKHTEAPVDTLNVALLYGPMSYYMYADTLGGYSYDLLREICRTEKVHMNFIPVNSITEGIRMLNNGRYDMLAALPQEIAVTHHLACSTPLFQERRVLLQKNKDNGKPAITSALDLAGDTIHIGQENPVYNKLKNLSREIGDTIYIIQHPSLSDELLTLRVESGQIRYAVVNERIATPHTLKHPSLNISSPISFTQFQCIATSPSDSALTAKINTWLINADKNPKIKELRRRYNLP